MKETRVSFDQSINDTFNKYTEKYGLSKVQTQQPKKDKIDIEIDESLEAITGSLKDIMNKIEPVTISLDRKDRRVNQP